MPDTPPTPPEKEWTDGQLLIRVWPAMSLVYAFEHDYFIPAEACPHMAEAIDTMPKFTLDMLVGRTPIAHRTIPNPRPYDATFGGQNAPVFHVLMFPSKDNEPVFWLTDEWRAVGEGTHTEHYFFEDRKVHYSKDLYKSPEAPPAKDA